MTTTKTLFELIAFHFHCSILGQTSVTSESLSQLLSCSPYLQVLFPISSQMWLTRLTCLKLDFHCILQLFICFSSLLPIKWDNICPSPLYVVSVTMKSNYYLIYKQSDYTTYLRKVVWFSRNILALRGRRSGFCHLIYKGHKNTYLKENNEFQKHSVNFRVFCQVNFWLLPYGLTVFIQLAGYSSLEFIPSIYPVTQIQLLPLIFLKLFKTTLCFGRSYIMFLYIT